MKHACENTLELLSGVLQAIRALPGVTERRPGIFYVKSAAYLHFHEDPAGLFADVKLSGKEFERFPVNTAIEKSVFVKRVTESRYG